MKKGLLYFLFAAFALVGFASVVQAQSICNNLVLKQNNAVIVTKSLSILSVTPDREESVRNFPKVRIQFSEKLDIASVDLSLIYVTQCLNADCSSEYPLPGVLRAANYDYSNIIWEAKTNIIGDGSYKVTVKDSVQSATGRNLFSEYASRFFVGPKPADYPEMAVYTQLPPQEDPCDGNNPTGVIAQNPPAAIPVGPPAAKPQPTVANQPTQTGGPNELPILTVADAGLQDNDRAVDAQTFPSNPSFEIGGAGCALSPAPTSNLWDPAVAVSILIGSMMWGLALKKRNLTNP